MTHMGSVSDLRNESGGRYYPCEHCMKGNAGTIYIKVLETGIIVHCHAVD